MSAEIETAVGQAYDGWMRTIRFTSLTSAYGWYVEQGGVESICIAHDCPSEKHSIVDPKDIGWLNRPQAVAYLTAILRRVPLLKP
jgi:hypothetical protein